MHMARFISTLCWSLQLLSASTGVRPTLLLAFDEAYVVTIYSISHDIQRPRVVTFGMNANEIVGACWTFLTNVSPRPVMWP